MVIILSPSKSSQSKSLKAETFTLPVFIEETSELINILKCKNRDEIKSIMSLSDKLADHTCALIDSLSVDISTENSRSAIYNFTGEVYSGLNAHSFSASDMEYAQKYLLILSGLYGILRPLDLMKTYRLEMGLKFKTTLGSNLYQFWGDKITFGINRSLQSSDSNYLLNLASDEYFKSVKVSKLDKNIINAEFFEMKGGKRSFVSFNAKRARGLMAAYVIKNRITHPDDLKLFDTEGYCYHPELSDDRSFVFVK
ncbi:MAG: peroxide stress protein YaaA [Saprospiraceae bacterium]|jgi:cytoplasmic iron level regulating protein YaaA (DUF328/UPF0246 family)|nr:peroxide stress protein YaaA [Saprospiraceae bacterium]